MCHTAINALGGSSESEAFQGGLIPMQMWYAPSLTSNKEAGLGDWSIKDISDLLRTGISSRGAVYGPMAEVVYNSLQYLSESDIRAMAIYLKSLAEGSPSRASAPVVSTDESSLLMSLGKTVYDSRCASCHGASGEGRPPNFPPLASNQSIEMESAVNRSAWCLTAASRRARAEIPGPLACRPSRRSCLTTKSRLSSPIFANPGAIAAAPSPSNRQMNCVRLPSTEFIG